MSEAADNGRITFTVKELLAKVDAKLDVIVAQLDSKAEAHALESLEVRVAVLEGSAATEGSLSRYRQEVADQRRTDRRWLLSFAVTSLLGFVGLSASVLFNMFN